MDYYEFDCGCKVEIIDNEIKAFDGLPSINIDFDKINLDCPATWDLISSGKTKGVFQLETSLGANWSKKLEPDNIEELAALGAVLRPGCLKSRLDGKSMTQHYVDRKHGVEQYKDIDHNIANITSETYGILCIHEDTYISMSNGLECKIKNLQAGSNIISVNKDITESDICKDVKLSPRKKGMLLTLKNGYRIILTEDHKVDTFNGFKMVKDLDINNDLVKIVNKQNCNLDSNVDFYGLPTNTNYAYLIGHLLGDGSSGKNIASGTDENHKKLLHFMLDKNKYKDLNISEYFHCRSNYISISGSELLDNNEYGNRKTIYRYAIEKLGLNNTKNNKNIPNEFFITNNKELRWAFLAGYFDSDGYSGLNEKTCVCTYCSNNKENINGLRKLLSIDGIETYISPDYKHLHVFNTEVFNKTVGKYILLKSLKGKLNNAPRYGKYPNIIKELFKKSNYSSFKKFCLDKKHQYKNNKFIHKNTAIKFDIIFKDISFIQIKSIENIEEDLNFYSISVENNRNLIGNGIVISNCYQEQSMQIAQKLGGFDLKQADSLRKAIGKKDSALMAKVRTEFIEGCKNTGLVNEEKANEIFDIIEKSNRYSFNKSISPKTLCQTENGKTKTIEEIKVGEKVKTPNGYSLVIEKYDHGELDTFEIELENGSKIECSINHKFLCDDGIYPLYEILQKNKKIIIDDSFGVC